MQRLLDAGGRHQNQAFRRLILVIRRETNFAEIFARPNGAIWPSITLAKITQKSLVTSESLHHLRFSWCHGLFK
jgi:hypothetical protein